MEESLTTEAENIIKNSIKEAFLMGILEERKLMGKWLEHEASNKKPEELVELLYSTIECLKRGVFPDQL